MCVYVYVRGGTVAIFLCEAQIKPSYEFCIFKFATLVDSLKENMKNSNFLDILDESKIVYKFLLSVNFMLILLKSRQLLTYFLAIYNIAQKLSIADGFF